MKEPYRWKYNIKIKTKEGEFEYEDQLDHIQDYLDMHKGYEEVKAKRLTPNKPFKVPNKPIDARNGHK